MYWRPIHATDLSECLELQTASLGDEIVGRDAALRIWRDLLESPAFQASVIESEQPVAGHRITGCGMGVFVTRAFAENELDHPRPGLNARIIAGVAAGESVVLDRDAIAAGNAGAGLDFVNLYGTWREGVLDAGELAAVQALLGTSFVENLAGFRFNAVLKEARGRRGIEFARATGTYRIIAQFPGHESALVAVSPDSARDAPYSMAARMYHYRAPVLRLRPAEQHLLAAALDGKTDAELSAALGISIEAVKKRWVSVFARVDEFRPEVIARTDADGGHRGPQKRHRVVAYVRSHPEELRPYAWEA
jgi:hypothetical protein